MAVHDDPIRVWRESYARRILNIDFEPAADAPFRADFIPIFPDLRIARTSLSPGVTFRDKQLVRDGDDAFSLMIASARLDVAHCGRELRLSQGDATLLHVCEIGSVGSPIDFGFTPVLISCTELAARGIVNADPVMQRIPRQSGTLRLLRAYIRALERGQLLASVEMRNTIREHIIDLVALTVTSHGAIGETTLSAVTAARLAAALDAITARFHEPRLTVTQVAHDLGISPRYLQRLIEGSGTSFTARVTELRLQKAFALLTESSMRIADAALAAGFSDISHFNRLFRARFGDTPSGTRATHRLNVNKRTTLLP